MKKMLFGIMACTMLFASCTKDDTSDNAPPGLSDNSLKITAPDGSVINVSYTEAYSQAFTDNGGYCSFIGRFNVSSASTYDRVAVGFKVMPDDGDYTIVYPPGGTVSGLPEGEASLNITYDGINYSVETADGATVNVKTSNGKKKVAFENALVHRGGTAVSEGTPLPDGCKITGVIIGS